MKIRMFLRVVGRPDPQLCWEVKAAQGFSAGSEMVIELPAGDVEFISNMNRLRLFNSRIEIGMKVSRTKHHVLKDLRIKDVRVTDFTYFPNVATIYFAPYQGKPWIEL